MGGTTLRGHYFLKKKGVVFKIRKELLCLLQDLKGPLGVLDVEHTVGEGYSYEDFASTNG